MVVAISSVLGLPVIVFCSASHYPIINITQRACAAAIPLYVAFNQVGVGHYDAVCFNRDIHQPPLYLIRKAHHSQAVQF